MTKTCVRVSAWAEGYGILCTGIGSKQSHCSRRNSVYNWKVFYFFLHPHSYSITASYTLISLFIFFNAVKVKNHTTYFTQLARRAVNTGILGCRRCAAGGLSLFGLLNLPGQYIPPNDGSLSSCAAAVAVVEPEKQVQLELASEVQVEVYLQVDPNHFEFHHAVYKFDTLLQHVHLQPGARQQQWRWHVLWSRTSCKPVI